MYKLTYKFLQDLESLVADLHYIDTTNPDKKQIKKQIAKVKKKITCPSFLNSGAAIIKKLPGVCLMVKFITKCLYY